MTEQQNLWELKNTADLQFMLKNNQTVIVGFVVTQTSAKDKITIKKFLKDKAQKFPFIMFVFMELQLSPNLIAKFGELKELKLISSNAELYPLLYHIRDGNAILIKIEKATFASLYESFTVVEKYYVAEMTDLLNKQQDDDKNTTTILTEKGELLKLKYEEYQTNLIKDIQNRKIHET